ncbi:MAG: Na/Pi symporter [Gemmatimonadetes bacterium]|nr:Na/Pi symporter [Gemmatimonadota bacterium]
MVPPRPEPEWHEHPAVRALLVLFLLYVFLVGVNGLGVGFKSLGRDLLDTFFGATANPFLGLMVGILGTTLVQSSSVSTALIVGLVAAPENPLPVVNAIPMIMGANIGTTVTNTIASLAHMGFREEFRRAFAVATCHDFFNYFAVILLLPLELTTRLLSRSATVLADLVGGFGGADYESPVKGLIEAGGVPIEAAVTALFTGGLAAAALIAVSVGLIFFALLAIIKVMRSATQSRVETLVSRAFENKPLVAMIVGAIATVMVQSSSITTSLLVPLAGAGVLTLGQAFPITLGANVGTTITALLAALAATGPNAEAGLVVALAHLLFNLLGIVLIYPVKRIRRLPLAAARGLANVAVRSRTLAILYVVILFYLLPAAFAYFGHVFG